ncbi:hypothetical protein MMPV_006522 [Pyropia vietnamensis]
MVPERGTAGASSLTAAVVTAVTLQTVLPAAGMLRASSCRDGQVGGAHSPSPPPASSRCWTGLLMLWAVLAAMGAYGAGGAEADVAIAVGSTIVLGGVGGASATAADRRRWGRRGGGGGGASGCYANISRGGSPARLLGVLVCVTVLVALMATAPRERWIGEGAGGRGRGRGGPGAAWVATAHGGGTPIADSAFHTRSPSRRPPLVAGAAAVNLLRPTQVERMTRVRLFDTSSTDEAAAVTLGSDGSVYLAGKTTPATANSGTIERAILGSSPSTSAGYGGDDVFVAKVSPSGHLLWVKSFGSAADEAATGVAVSTAGVFVVGHTRGQLSPTIKRVGAVDFFLSRLSASTGSLMWTVQDGSIGRDALSAVVIGDDGDIFAAGHVGGAFLRPPVAARDVLVVRYRSDGRRVWAVQHQVGRASSASSLALSPTDGSLAVGVTAYRSVQGDQETSDAAVVRMSAAGKVLWTAHSPTFSQTFVSAVAVDKSGAVYVGASEWKHVYENFNVHLRKLSSMGAELWVTELSSAGAHADYASAVGLSPDGRSLLVAGYSAGNFLLTTAEEEAVAAAVSSSGSSPTGAPSHFTGIVMQMDAATGAEMVRFQDTPADKHTWQQLRALAVDPSGVLLLAGYERSLSPEDPATTDATAKPKSTINVLLASFVFRTMSATALPPGSSPNALAAAPLVAASGDTTSGSGSGGSGGPSNSNDSNLDDGGSATVIGGSMVVDGSPAAGGESGSDSGGGSHGKHRKGSLPLPLLAGGAGVGVALIAVVAVAVALSVRASTSRLARRQAGPTSAAASGGAGRHAAPAAAPAAAPVGGGRAATDAARPPVARPAQPPGTLPTRTVFWGTT